MLVLLGLLLELLLLPGGGLAFLLGFLLGVLLLDAAQHVFAVCFCLAGGLLQGGLVFGAVVFCPGDLLPAVAAFVDGDDVEVGVVEGGEFFEGGFLPFVGVGGLVEEGGWCVHSVLYFTTRGGGWKEKNTTQATQS